MKTLVINVGGTNIKLLATGQQEVAENPVGVGNDGRRNGPGRPRCHARVGLRSHIDRLMAVKQRSDAPMAEPRPALTPAANPLNRTSLQRVWCTAPAHVPIGHVCRHRESQDSGSEYRRILPASLLLPASCERTST